MQCAAVMADNVDICGEPSGDCGRVGVAFRRVRALVHFECLILPEVEKHLSQPA